MAELKAPVRVTGDGHGLSHYVWTPGAYRALCLVTTSECDSLLWTYDTTKPLCGICKEMWTHVRSLGARKA